MDYWNRWILWLKLLLFLLKGEMFCSVFAGEGEGGEVMVLFTDCPAVQTYRQKEKKTFGIKTISQLSCNNIGLCFVSESSAFFFYVSFNNKCPCSCPTMQGFQHFHLKYRLAADVMENARKLSPGSLGCSLESVKWTPAFHLKMCVKIGWTRWKRTGADSSQPSFVIFL